MQVLDLTRRDPRLGHEPAVEERRHQVLDALLHVEALVDDTVRLAPTDDGAGPRAGLREGPAVDVRERLVARRSLDERHEHGGVRRVVQPAGVVDEVVAQRSRDVAVDVDRVAVDERVEHLARQGGHVRPVAVDRAPRDPRLGGEPVDRQPAESVGHEHAAHRLVHRRPGPLVPCVASCAGDLGQLRQEPQVHGHADGQLVGGPARASLEDRPRAEVHARTAVVVVRQPLPPLLG